MNVLIELEELTCSDCGVTFAIPAVMRKARLNNHQIWYCPSGHSQYFPAKSEAEKLREELRRAKSQLEEFEGERERRRQRMAHARASRKLRAVS